MVDRRSRRVQLGWFCNQAPLPSTAKGNRISVRKARELDLSLFLPKRKLRFPFGRMSRGSRVFHCTAGAARMSVMNAIGLLLALALAVYLLVALLCLETFQ